MSKNQQLAIVLVDRIEPCILTIRGQRVILDADLAALYGVPTKRLNEQVKRNPNRFPADFMFRLSAEEAETIRSQVATASGRPPAMRPQTATADLRSQTATSSPTAKRLPSSPRVDLRSQIVTSSSGPHGGRRYLPYAFTEHGAIMAAIRRLMEPPPPPPRPKIGFHAGRKTK